MAQVKASETAKPDDPQTMKGALWFRGSVGSFDDVLVGYFFAQGKLVRAVYSFTGRHTEPNLYLEDFMTIKNTLYDKYGAATSYDKIWKDDLYKDDQEHWGTAVLVGQLVLQSTWKTDQTSVTETLRGDKFEAFLLVQYRSIELGALEDQEQQKNEKADF